MKDSSGYENKRQHIKTYYGCAHVCVRVCVCVSACECVNLSTNGTEPGTGSDNSKSCNLKSLHP